MLQRQLKKFAHQPKLNEIFPDQMLIYCNRFARKLSPKELRFDFPHRNYLIHHGIMHEKKPGRVRVVCNASSVFQKESLNGIIFPGPNLINEITAGITRLREFPVWVTDDIVKFFHHVNVRKTKLFSVIFGHRLIRQGRQKSGAWLASLLELFPAFFPSKRFFRLKIKLVFS